MTARCPTCQAARSWSATLMLAALAFLGLSVYALSTVFDYARAAKDFKARSAWMERIAAEKNCVYYPPPTDSSQTRAQDTVRRTR